MSAIIIYIKHWLHC